jgi:uncharacterized protein
MNESWKEKGRITLRIRTNAPKTQIISYEDNILRVDVKALPEEGKANKEIIRFFSKLLKKKIEISSGKTSKTKIIKLIE